MESYAFNKFTNLSIFFLFFSIKKNALLRFNATTPRTDAIGPAEVFDANVSNSKSNKSYLVYCLNW